METKIKNRFAKPTLMEGPGVLIAWALIWGGAFYGSDLIWLAIKTIYPDVPHNVRILVFIFGMPSLVGLFFVLLAFSKRRGNKIEEAFLKHILLFAVLVGGVIGYSWHGYTTTTSDEFAFKRVAYENCKQIALCRDKTEREADALGIWVSFNKQ